MPLVTMPVRKISLADQVAEALIANSLSISGDGIDGATNNNFLDSSSRNLSSTTSGIIGQGPQTPFYGNAYSVSFNGSSSLLRVPTNASLNLNQGDWCLEGSFCLMAAVGANAAIFGWGSSTGGATPYIPIYLTPAGHIVAEEVVGSAVWNIDVAFAPIIGRFYNVTLLRRSNVIYLYIDGVQIGSAAYAGTHMPGMNFSVGCMEYSTGSQWFFPGIVSNVRLVKSSSVYTGAFTPGTIPLTVIANTSFLICSAYCFKDISTNNNTVTTSGFPKVVQNSPFRRAVATNDYGGSAFFDTSSYVQFNTDSVSIFGTGQFLSEAWIYPTDNSGPSSIFGNLGGVGTGFCLYLQPTGRVEASTYAAGILNSGSINVPYFAWSHVVCCRDANNLIAIFINGVRAATVTSGINIDSPAAWRIGSVGPADAVTKFKGHLTGVRVVKGSSVYNPALTTLTVPTMPAVDQTNTGFLYNFANTNIFDNSFTSAIATVGGAKISTARHKSGTGSVLFNGVADYLFVQPSFNYEFPGDLTIEFWLYAEPNAVDQDLIGNYVSNAAPDWTCMRKASGAIAWYPGSLGATIQSAAIADNTWVHVALVRIGSTCTLYIDGVSVGTMNKTGTLGDVTRPLRVGARGPSNFLKGNMESIQITKGAGLRTANFVPA